VAYYDKRILLQAKHTEFLRSDDFGSLQAKFAVKKVEGLKMDLFFSLSSSNVLITCFSVCLGFFFLLEYPKINAIISKINRTTKPIQKKDGKKKAITKNMTSPEIERVVSSNNFMIVVLLGDVY